MYKSGSRLKYSNKSNLHKLPGLSLSIMSPGARVEKVYGSRARERKKRANDLVSRYHRSRLFIFARARKSPPRRAKNTRQKKEMREVALVK